MILFPIYKENFPEIQIIQNDGNYGYAKGYNLALKQIDAEYFVLLNSDIEVTKDWISPIISLMEENNYFCLPTKNIRL